MMKTNRLLVLAAAAFALAGCKNAAEGPVPKCIVLYYSQTGTTEILAEEFASQLNCKAVSFDLINPYDGTYEETIARCLEEKETKRYSALDELFNVDPSLYDVIFIGYPIWFGTYAIPVIPFYAKCFAGLEGKTVVPFCTFGSGGLEGSVADMRKLMPHSTIADGFGIRAARIDKAPEEVKAFLISGGYLEGEIEELPEYGEPYPVGEEELALFEEACGSYPMPLGAPTTVCRRETGNSTDFIFNTVSQSQEGEENEFQIYVSRYEDATVDFIKVVR